MPRLLLTRKLTKAMRGTAKGTATPLFGKCLTTLERAKYSCKRIAWCKRRATGLWQSPRRPAR